MGITATPTTALTGSTVQLTALIDGRTTDSVWEFGDGLVEINQPYSSHAWAAPGDYLVSLWAFNQSYPQGVSATVTVHVVALAVHNYVAADSANPAAPYTSWVTAATNIQDAVDWAAPGALVEVTNGIYAAGGRNSSRVAVDKPLAVRSVNGPRFTVIQGSQGPEGTRCAYLTNGASLSGFTLTNGYVGCVGLGNSCLSGAGVYCESANAVLTNCVVTGNSASSGGGGAYGGTLNNCTLTSNSARNGNGGGAYCCTLNNCTLTGNWASYGGGAAGGGGFLASPCRLNNCALTGNSATTSGGGAFGCTLNNCTVTGNLAPYGGGVSGSCGSIGPNSYSALSNCTVFFNKGSLSPNYDGCTTLNYCCTTPLPADGVGNISADPELASAFRLSALSPCIGKGSYAAVSGTDIDGEPWANPP